MAATVVPLGAAVAVATEEDIGAFAESVESQTSSGSTRESSRKTRSQATRRESAALSAWTRVALSVASAFWVRTFEASGVGIAASSSCSCVSSASLPTKAISNAPS